MNQERRKWDKCHMKGINGTKRDEPSKTIPDFMNFLSEYGDKWILDAGCGNGENTAEISIHGKKVLGVDFSMPALKKAKKCTDGKSVEIHYVLADINNLPFKKGNFSAIYSIDSLNKSNTPSIKEFHDILDYGGLLYLRLLYKKEDKKKVRRNYQFPDDAIENFEDYFTVLEKSHYTRENNLYKQTFLTFKMMKKQK